MTLWLGEYHIMGIQSILVWAQLWSDGSKFKQKKQKNPKFVRLEMTGDILHALFIHVMATPFSKLDKEYSRHVWKNCPSMAKNDIWSVWWERKLLKIHGQKIYINVKRSFAWFFAIDLHKVSWYCATLQVVRLVDSKFSWQNENKWQRTHSKWFFFHATLKK